jgi:hypothetical protein
MHVQMRFGEQLLELVLGLERSSKCFASATSVPRNHARHLQNVASLIGKPTLACKQVRVVHSRDHFVNVQGKHGPAKCRAWQL